MASRYATSAARRQLRKVLNATVSGQRALHGGSYLMSSVPATSVAAKQGGLLSWLLGKPAVSLPPLYEPLAGLQLPPPLEEDIPVAETKITTLSNGLRIASEDKPGALVSVGIYVDSGSVYEGPETSGASHLLEKMAFKSTANRSHFRLVREVEAIGANVIASASREQMAYVGDGLKTYLPEILELLVDTVRNSVFNEWEVKEQAAKVRSDIQAAMSRPEVLLQEALHSAAYIGGLGNPLMASDASLARLSGESLFNFVSENYTAPRIVVAAAGVEHDELVALAESLLSDLPKVELADVPASHYVGGEWRGSAPSEATHIAMGFEFPGGWRNEKESVTATVLLILLGGGGSFSAGGPGKGMYSKLYTNVLNEHSEVRSCNAFASIYNTTGIFGIQAVADSSFTPELVDTLTKEFLKVATPGKVSETELQRAKNATISTVLMQLESRAIAAEDIGRQILTFGKRKGVSEFVDLVNSVTANDITELTHKLLSSPLSFAAFSDVVSVPRFDQIASRFGR
eukprot:TRINITY_DN6840_c0_g1_i2.p1 TRINITY_DN6840_c0_g1~~TRINITY_DN6840_c0_g1_i2.p1  ORF type:complete len:534 (+),score=123.82 TRINITY_DN6840_c0_g1_i2:57-1604(+)